jgi:ATP-dependent RNA helicase RhlE
MLDMGFLRDVRKIVAALPGRRQSLLFSATMPGEIEQLSRTLLDDPAKVEIAAKSIAVERIEQRVYHVAMQAKRKLLAALLDDPALSRVIVFTRTKHGANKVATQLGKAGVETEALHGNKSQTARQRALARFRDGDARVLVATDIAARGIDVDEVSHVINYDLPNVPESYVHRIGRTARAGAEGIALSFCDTSEREHLRAIEKLTRVPLAVVEADGFAAPAHEAAGTDKPKGRNRNRNKGPKGPSSPRGEAPGPQAGPKSASQRRRNRRRRARAAGDIQNRRAA